MLSLEPTAWPAGFADTPLGGLTWGGSPPGRALTALFAHRLQPGPHRLRPGDGSWPSASSVPRRRPYSLASGAKPSSPSRRHGRAMLRVDYLGATRPCATDRAPDSSGAPGIPSGHETLLPEQRRLPRRGDRRRPVVVVRTPRAAGGLPQRLVDRAGDLGGRSARAMRESLRLPRSRLRTPSTGECEAPPDSAPRGLDPRQFGLFRCRSRLAGWCSSILTLAAAAARRKRWNRGRRGRPFRIPAVYERRSHTLACKLVRPYVEKLARGYHLPMVHRSRRGRRGWDYKGRYRWRPDFPLAPARDRQRLSRGPGQGDGQNLAIKTYRHGTWRAHDARAGRPGCDISTSSIRACGRTPRRCSRVSDRVKAQDKRWCVREVQRNLRTGIYSGGAAVAAENTNRAWLVHRTRWRKPRRAGTHNRPAGGGFRSG